MESAKLQDTGERMVPEFHKARLLYAEHVIRYQAAAELVRGRRVLDIASGSGYGSAILGETAASVIGVDLDPDAVAYATSRFAGDNVEFRQGSAVAIPLDDDSVDVVITFETIEHIADYESFLDEIERVLAPGGLAVVSTPNDLEFAEGNHFHLHEFERSELLGVLGKRFSHVDEYYQSTWKYVGIGPLSELASEEASWRTLNLAPAELEAVLYFYFLCANRPIDERLPALGALGEHYSDRDLAAERVEAAGTRADYEAERVRAERLEYELSLAHSELAGIKDSRTFRVVHRIAMARARLAPRRA